MYGTREDYTKAVLAATTDKEGSPIPFNHNGMCCILILIPKSEKEFMAIFNRNKKMVDEPAEN
eukprot:12592476-Ditylum_brightwellii.AAC.1